MAKRLSIQPGDKFNHLTYIRDAKSKKLPSGQKPRIARCKCDCGKVKNILLLHLVRGRIKCCGCKKYRQIRESVMGIKFGTITVIKELNDLIVKGREFRMVEGICECGIKWIGRLNNLRYMKSCGCIKAKITREKFTTHGLTNHSLYSHWNNMKNRCYNQNVESYGYCGSKGVRVCKEWKINFKAFYDWSIANGWESGLTLDRYPNKNGNYSPGNCRWADGLQQANNKNTNVLYTYNGETKTLAEFSYQYGFNYKRVHARIKKLKWSIKSAFETA